MADVEQADVERADVERAAAVSAQVEVVAVHFVEPMPVLQRLLLLRLVRGCQTLARN